MERNVDVQSLLRALRIAEAGSIKRASLELRIAQPALSRSIKLLEEQAGAKLFDRSVKGVTLTAVGQRLMAHARVIRREMEIAEADLQSDRQAKKKVLRFGVPPVHALEIFVSSLLATHTEFPDTLLKIEVSDTPELLDRVLLGQLEFVFGPILGPDLPAGLVEDILYYEDWCIACGPKNPLASRSEVRLEELSQQRWVLGGPGSHSRLRMEEFCSLHGIDVPEAIIEIDTVPPRREIVAQSDMLTLVQRGNVERSATYLNLSILPFDWRQVNRPIGIQRIKGARPSRFLHRYREKIREGA